MSSFYGNGGGSSQGGNILAEKMYICGVEEYDAVTGLPSIENPEEGMFYLVPLVSEDENNLFNEFIYKNGNWEKFGSGGVSVNFDEIPTAGSSNVVTSGGLNNYIMVVPGTGTGSAKMKGSSVASGNLAFAEGDSTTASGLQSHAEGYHTTASGGQSHAEGIDTKASNYQSHAEGAGTTASGSQSHAEGSSTKASGTSSHAEGAGTTAASDWSHAEGQGGNFTLNDVQYISGAKGQASHSEGHQTAAEGTADHTEGYQTRTAPNTQPGNHAEGYQTAATGGASHAEGSNTTASGNCSHTEGNSTIASSFGSHAEGMSTKASGSQSHAEGYQTTASGANSHAEGGHTIASGGNSHAEGTSSSNFSKTINNKTYTQAGAYGYAAHSEGTNTLAITNNSHAEGVNTIASGQYSHAEGDYTTASSDGSHVEGQRTIASGRFSHAEGLNTTANHRSQHVFGEYNVEDSSEEKTSDRGRYVEIIGNGTSTTARSNARTLDWSGNEVLAGKLTVGAQPTENMDVATKQYVDQHSSSGGLQNLVDGSTTGSVRGIGAAAEDSYTMGLYAVAEGYSTTASGSASHAEGQSTKASGNYSHAEGYSTKAFGNYSHAEGYSTTASGSVSHAEGQSVNASGNYSHAEGGSTTASGYYSHAEGNGTIANHAFQHVFGQNNVADASTAAASAKGNYIEIVGNGTSSSARSNARTLDWDGNETLAGTLTVANDPVNNLDVATKQYVDTNGLTPAAKLALLNCFKYVAWIDENGRNYYNALKTALGVSEQSEGWDYEWSVEDGTVPDGMSYQSFSWSEEPGALLVFDSNLNFNCIGDCEIEVECKWHAVSGSATMQNPQIVICTATSANGNSGAKIFGNPTSGRNIQTSVSGSTVDTGISGDVYHIYNFKSEGGQLTLTVDNNQVTTGTGLSNSQYIPYTGITGNSVSGCGLFFKSIKFKEL